MGLIGIYGDSLSTYEGYNPDGYAVYYDRFNQGINGLESVKDTWWSKVIDEMGGELFVNNSYSGSRVTGEGFPSATDATRLSAFITDDGVPDMILVYLGFNDFGYCVRRYRAGWPRNPADCFDYSYLDMLRKLKAMFPHVSIACATLMKPHLYEAPTRYTDINYDGVNIGAYNEIIRSAVRKADCFLADLAGTGTSYETVDGVHPNRNGHAAIARAWMRFLS